MKTIPILSTIIIFLVAAVVLYFSTHAIIPLLNNHYGLIPILSWFLAGGVFVFIPLFIFAILFVRKEVNSNNIKTIARALNLRPMSKSDWKFAIVGLGATYIFSAMIMAVIKMLSPDFNPSPGFMKFDGFTPDQYWMILLWLPFFFFNIVGEEIMWRGYILPRQQHRSGSIVMHSFLWGVFHLAFGMGLLLTLIPILIILPYTVCKTQNTWVGIFIHGVFNGSGFLLIAFNII